MVVVFCSRYGREMVSTVSNVRDVAIVRNYTALHARIYVMPERKTNALGKKCQRNGLSS